MWAPDEMLLLDLIRKHFATVSLKFRHVRLRILTHIERTPEAVAAFRRVPTGNWRFEKRAVTERLVLELARRRQDGRLKSSHFLHATASS
jgi:hypothetical protein